MHFKQEIQQQLHIQLCITVLMFCIIHVLYLVGYHRSHDAAILFGSGTVHGNKLYPYGLFAVNDLVVCGVLRNH